MARPVLFKNVASYKIRAIVGQVLHFKNIAQTTSCPLQLLRVTLDLSAQPFLEKKKKQTKLSKTSVWKFILH